MMADKPSLRPEIGSLAPLSDEKKSELVLCGLSKQELLAAIQGACFELVSSQDIISFDAVLKDGRTLKGEGRLSGTELKVGSFDVFEV